MHGLVNRGLQAYVRDIFSVDVWEDACTEAGLSFFNFETMLTYEDEITDRLIDAVAGSLGRSRPEVLEDFGTYVVSEQKLATVRKLLRFGGEDYEEFLMSLEDAHDRAKIAIPDLDVPQFEVESLERNRFRLHYTFQKRGYGAVFLGLLRGMADAYGALVFIDHSPVSGPSGDKDTFDISIHQIGWPDVSENARTQLEVAQ